MAKIMAKCFYCGVSFDRNQEKFVKVPGQYQRYAHLECYNNRDSYTAVSDKIHEKTKEYLGYQYNRTKVSAQIKKFVQQGIKEEDILNAVEYWYRIKENSAAKSQGGIGIVPHIIDESIAYWNKIAETQQQLLEKKDIENILHPKEVVIKVKREPIKKPVNKTFFMLD